jgi:hypothetical protein
MTIAPITKQQIYRALETLTPDALSQVAQVISALQKPSKSPLRLAGLWSNIPFDIDDKAVRSLRRRASRQTLKRRI